ncbi:MAG: hypothetical protein ACNS61_06915, partial [Candidatus Wenzhouxiangella sp. M2_3B_020]
MKILAVPVGVPGHLGPPGDFHPHVTSRFGFPETVESASYGASRHAWRTKKSPARRPGFFLNLRSKPEICSFDLLGGFGARRTRAVDQLHERHRRV